MRLRDSTANRNPASNPAGKGPSMKLTIRNAHEEWREPVEKETQRQAAKLEKLLKRYSPDLVLLHADIEKHARKETYTFTVNLSLPTGTLHATGEGSDVLASVKVAFSEICTQCKKHQALLRKDYEWKRKRPHARILAPE
jgi:ribosome-associated translation inhibitor RaiA